MTNSQKFNIPTEIVILGAAGDLAQTKLLPALFDLYIKGLLPDAFVIIGLSLTPMSDEEFRDFAEKTLGRGMGDTEVASFRTRLRYVAGDFNDSNTFTKLKERLFAYDDEIGQCSSKLFYVAVQPSLYSTIFTKLKESGVMALCSGVGTWSRLLVEKPFGKDLETAIALEQQLNELFQDNQIYRIDHYLAKDTVENIVALRFANNLFSSAWNNTAIESITLRLYETKDVATRGAFYRDIGALRDVGQNHLLQMFALLTMQPTIVDNSDHMRAARTNALKLLEHSVIKKITRGQYEGFTGTEGVGVNSTTETYFKLEAEIDTNQWNGVNFIFESGKAMEHEVAEAIVAFRQSRDSNGNFSHAHSEQHNELHITFSPKPSIALTLWVKKPGFDFTLEKRVLELVEATEQDTSIPSAYERVLFDAICGNQTRFVSGPEVMAAWEFITPVLQTFETLPLLLYKQGTNGPITI